MSKKWIVLMVFVTSLMLAACTTPVVSTTQEGEVPALDEILSPEIAQSVQSQISTLLGVPVESIQIVSIEQMEWPDGCLGLGTATESCIQEVTPGWLLVFSVDGQEFRFRINETATVIRQEMQETE